MRHTLNVEFVQKDVGLGKSIYVQREGGRGREVEGAREEGGGGGGDVCM